MFLSYQKEALKQWKETLLSFLIAILCLLLFYFFPTDDYLQTLTKNTFFFLIIPFLYVKLILQRELNYFGINWKNKKTGMFWGGLFLAFLTLLFFLIIRYTEFDQAYSPPDFARTSFGYFLFYELVLVNLLFLLQEMFFKGFLLSALREKLGYWSILIQFAVFLFPLLIFSDYFFETLPMILISLLGGFVAYKSRSFVFSYIAGLIFLILLDAYIIFITK